MQMLLQHQSRRQDWHKRHDQLQEVGEQEVQREMKSSVAVARMGTSSTR